MIGTLLNFMNRNDHLHQVFQVALMHDQIQAAAKHVAGLFQDNDKEARRAVEGFAPWHRTNSNRFKLKGK